MTPPASVLLTWISSWSLPCSTIYLDQKQDYNFLQGLADHAKVISEQPWDLMNQVLSPDCASLIVGDETREYQNIIYAVKKTRMKSTMGLIMTANSTSLDVITSSEPFFNVHVLAGQVSGNQYVEHLISPWDEYGKAKRRQVSVSYLIFNPYIVELGSPPVGIDGRTLETLSKSLSIKVDYVPVKTFTELVDKVATDKVDFCLSHPSIALHRFRMGLDFITMYWRNMFYIQRYPVPVDSLYTVTYPFAAEVWRATLATVTIVALFLCSLNYFYGHRPPLTFQELSISYKTIVGANVPAYWFDKRLRNPYYIMFFIWLLFGSILSVAYQSNLLANLVKVEMEKQPQTFQDLIDMQIGMYIVKGSILTSFLRDSPREVHRNVYKESLLKHGGFYPDNILPPDVMDIILSGKAVTLWPGEGLAIYQHLLVRGTEPMPNGPVGYLYRMNLPIKDELNKALMTLLECGTIKEIRRRIDFLLTKAWREAQQTKPGHEPVVISMSHFIPMLLLLVVGIFITTISFVLEITWPRSTKRLHHLNALHFKQKGHLEDFDSNGLIVEKYEAKQWEPIRLS